MISFSHRPRFDSVAHQVLFTCRYRIVVPDGESVFEYFFNIDIKTCSKNTLLTKSIPPMVCPEYSCALKVHTYIIHLFKHYN